MSKTVPKVLNKSKGRIPPDAVYIGRPSKWGNPYVIGRDGTREEVIAKYKLHLHTTGLVNSVDELRGKDLVCFCAPKPCHGDILIRLANDKHQEPKD